MAIIKRISSKSAVGGVLKYVGDLEKTKEKLISGIECTPETAKEEFKVTKQMYDNEKGVQYHHIIQSFKPGEVTLSKAHSLGKELSEKQFKGHECIIATHSDRDHIHNHIIVNSVSKETGKKYRATKESLREIKKDNDRLCERENLSVPKQNPNRYISQKELQPAMRGESWKFRLMGTIDHVKRRVKTRQEYIKEMEKEGYQVKWTDNRKYITYTTPENKKVRDSRLGNGYSKEEMENGFRQAQKNEHEWSRELSSGYGNEQKDTGTDKLEPTIKKGAGELSPEGIFSDITRTIEEIAQKAGRGTESDVGDPPPKNKKPERDKQIDVKEDRGFERERERSR